MKLVTSILLCICVGINECCSVTVAACEGQRAASTPHDVSTMSLCSSLSTLGIILDEALVYVTFQSVARRGPFEMLVLIHVEDLQGLYSQ